MKIFSEKFRDRLGYFGGRRLKYHLFTRNEALFGFKHFGKYDLLYVEKKTFIKDLTIKFIWEKPI